MNNFDNVELSLSFPAGKKPSKSANYRECLKNHAAAIGGHAVDGCGEFTPAAGPESLTCGACMCHRNFHRKEEEEEVVDPTPKQNQQTPEPVFLRFYPCEKTTPFEADNHNLHLHQNKNKRYRTKFTAEQKERMTELAEMVGWKLQKQHEAAVEGFCRETGVSRRAFKVWMHNNKHILAKKSPP